VLNFEELSQLHANVAHVVNSMEHIVNQPVSTDRLEHAKMYYLSYRDVDLRLLKKMEQLESSLMRG
jgi:hypothetical protein